MYWGLLMTDAVEITKHAESRQLEAFAKVAGVPLTELPSDLYILPQALEIFLETFEGPLDLLLYLIKKQNLDILDIPIAEITRQYIQYMELMKTVQLELAAEYMVMAATLAEIKSRLLLPRPVGAETEEDDPRAELIRRLQQYERFKQAALDLDELPRWERDLFTASTELPEFESDKPLPEVKLEELLRAFQTVMRRTKLNAHHQIQREGLSVRESMTRVLNCLSKTDYCSFEALLLQEQGRLGVVVTFLAILNLVNSSMVELVQSQAFSPIHLKVAA